MVRVIFSSGWVHLSLFECSVLILSLSLSVSRLTFAPGDDISVFLDFSRGLVGCHQVSVTLEETETLSLSETQKRREKTVHSHFLEFCSNAVRYNALFLSC